MASQSFDSSTSFVFPVNNWQNPFVVSVWSFSEQRRSIWGPNHKCKTAGTITWSRMLFLFSPTFQLYLSCSTLFPRFLHAKKQEAHRASKPFPTQAVTLSRQVPGAQLAASGRQRLPLTSHSFLISKSVALFDVAPSQNNFAPEKLFLPCSLFSPKPGPRLDMS
jgi:hypothetical protein